MRILQDMPNTAATISVILNLDESFSTNRFHSKRDMKKAQATKEKLDNLVLEGRNIQEHY